MQEGQTERDESETVPILGVHEQPHLCWVTLLTRMVYLVGGLGFVMSLGMTVYADRTPEGDIEMEINGITALCFGWFLLAGLCPAWIANLLLPPTVYYLEAGRPRVAFWYATVAVLTSLTIFLMIPPFDRGQVGAVMFVGCWVWIGSIAVLWLSTVLRLMLDRCPALIPVCVPRIEAAVEVEQSPRGMATSPISVSTNFMSSYAGGLAVMAFVVACLLPVIRTDNRNPHSNNGTLGIVVLLMGWMPQSLASVAWLANPLAVLSLHSMFRGRRRMAIVSSTLASVCSWFVVVIAYLRLPFAVGEWRLLPGSWFWLASIGLVWLSTMLRVDLTDEDTS